MAVGENPVFYASAKAGALSKGPQARKAVGDPTTWGVRDGSASYFWQPEPWKRGLPKGYQRARAKTGQALSCNVLSPTSSHLFSLPSVPSRNPPDPTRLLTLLKVGHPSLLLPRTGCVLSTLLHPWRTSSPLSRALWARTAGTSNHGAF